MVRVGGGEGRGGGSTPWWIWAILFGLFLALFLRFLSAVSRDWQYRVKLTTTTPICTIFRLVHNTSGQQLYISNV